MDHASVTRETFDAYAAGYEEKFNQNFLAKYQRETVYKAIVPFLKDARTLLDVGCGPGSDFAFYKSMDVAVDAIDISPEMAKIAKKTAAAIQLTATIENASLENFQSKRVYDIIILNFGVINLIENLPMALTKLKSLLKPVGVFAIVDAALLSFFDRTFNNFQISAADYAVASEKGGIAKRAEVQLLSSM